MDAMRSFSAPASTSTSLRRRTRGHEPVIVALLIALAVYLSTFLTSTVGNDFAVRIFGGRTDQTWCAQRGSEGAVLPACAQRSSEGAVMPAVVLEQLAELQAAGRARLATALAGSYPPPEAPFSSPFADVVITLPLPLALVHASDGHGQDSKYFLGPSALKFRDRDCVVYAAGLDKQHRFESDMVALGCTVHGFDCTVVSALPDWDFTFHDWCIGAPRSFEGNLYSQAKTSMGAGFTFKSLTDIKAELGHPRLDVLKMDIEGFEWDLLDSLLTAPDEDLPDQILFELHTDGSNPEFVPPQVVAGKRKQAVDSLFLRLYDRGYRVAHWELNDGDEHCAEFSIARVRSSEL